MLQADCASPLEGQYITVQKYDYKITNDNNVHEIIELHVEVFCGPFISSSGETSLCVIEEPDEPCARGALAIGKSTLQ